MRGKLAQILRATLPDYRRSQRLRPDQEKACAAVMRCRTGELGSVRASCRCGYSKELACSCRNRHCPLCQGEAALRWKESYEDKLPEVPTYHGVFTVPSTLHRFFQARPREMYGLLFDAVSATLQRFSDKDRRLEGARLGLVAILHTWGSQLQFHPHLHLLICAGGFTAQGQWRSLPHSQGFLFPVDHVATVFRGILLERIERFLSLHPEWFEDPPAQLLSLLRRAALHRWRVFVQRSRKSPVYALNYLARYTHRVAISEGRIEHFDDQTVTLRCRQKSQSPPATTGRMPTVEFVRRFLEHILPPGFHKIRAYGFLVRGWREARRRSRPHRPPAFASPTRGVARLCPSCGSALSYLLCGRLATSFQLALPP